LDAEPDPIVTADGRLNAEQVRALRRSLGSDTVFVWGPPGTGKTETLARIVEAHYRAGRSVLLVSNTNIAVDTALERIADRLKGEPDFHSGLVIRQGPVVKKELRERFGPQVILEEIVKRLAEPLLREKDGLSRQVAPLEHEERSLRAALRDFERLAEARKALNDAERWRSHTRAAIESRNQEAAKYRECATKMAADLERARTMGLIRRLLSGLDPKRLERERTAAERQAQAAGEAARALAADLSRIESKVQDLHSEIEVLDAKTRRYPPEPQIKAQLDEVGTRLGQVRQRIAAIDAELATLEEEVLRRCRILATTVYRTYLGTAPARQFDAVVIDEASMLMPPLVYYAAGLAAASVTIAGDFRQLPPIVASEEQLACEWLRRDVFHMANIPEHLKRRQDLPHLAALSVQYRMCEPICAVLNELFYDDHPLCTQHDAQSGREVAFPLTASPLLYVDTSPLKPWTAFRPGSYSRYNLCHALLARNIVLRLAEAGFLPPAGEPNDAFGVITPYASQARLIQALLDERLGERGAGIASTVHRFQGNEKRAIVLDLTDSLGAKLGHFLKAEHIDEEGARLLNVAVSRAREHLVLIGNFEYLRDKALSHSFVRRLIAHFEEHGEAADLQGVLQLVECDWIDGLRHVLPPGFDVPEDALVLYNEGSFYPAFAGDLAGAKESIVIFSPFASGPGTARWADSFRAAIGRGVSVRVVTRPSTESEVGNAEEMEELVEGLRQTGVVVDMRAGMHEKLVIVDGRVLWHGSLNILSHCNTSESMLRIESPAACQQVCRLLSPPAGGTREPAPAFAALGNPECPKCGGPTVWKKGQHGIWFQCEDPECGGKVDPRRRSHRQAGRSSDGRTRARRGAGRPCPEPGCGGTLRERRGRFGRFLGCSNYPTCRYTEDLDARDGGEDR